MHADPIKISIFRATCADLCNFNLICCKLIKILFIYSRRSRGFSTWMWAQRGSSLPIRASKHHISNLRQITMSQWWHLTMKLNYTRSRLFTEMLSKILFIAIKRPIGTSPEMFHCLKYLYYYYQHSIDAWEYCITWYPDLICKEGRFYSKTILAFDYRS